MDLWYWLKNVGREENQAFQKGATRLVRQEKRDLPWRENDDPAMLFRFRVELCSNKPEGGYSNSVLQAFLSDVSSITKDLAEAPEEVLLKC